MNLEFKYYSMIAYFTDKHQQKIGNFKLFYNNKYLQIINF